MVRRPVEDLVLGGQIREEPQKMAIKPKELSRKGDLHNKTKTQTTFEGETREPTQRVLQESKKTIGVHVRLET
jgi:hypothetical protein